MAVKVEDGEEYTRGFLDSPESEKGPFSVELVEREVMLAEIVCDLTLTGIVAFGGTVPQEKTEMERELACEGLGYIGGRAMGGYAVQVLALTRENGGIGVTSRLCIG